MGIPCDRFVKNKYEPTPKSPINWILSGVERCKRLIIRIFRIRSVSGFPLNCLFRVDSMIKLKIQKSKIKTTDQKSKPVLLIIITVFSASVAMITSFHISKSPNLQIFKLILPFWFAFLQESFHSLLCGGTVELFAKFSSFQFRGLLEIHGVAVTYHFFRDRNRLGAIACHL